MDFPQKFGKIVKIDAGDSFLLVLTDKGLFFYGNNYFGID